MGKFSLKTQLLNNFRSLGKNPFLERLLVTRTLGKPNDSFFAKIAPNNYQYPPKTMRRCRREGIEYDLDISDYMQYCIYYGIETEPRDRLYNLVKDGTTIIDVGTNIGETLLNLAKLNPNGKNIGFEPVPFLFEKARKHVDLNGFSNVILENSALSDKTGSLVFNYGNENNSGGIFLTGETSNKDTSKIVTAETLDEYTERCDVKGISLIKIDVEGFEMNVLKGATQTLKKNKPDLFVEVNDKFLHRQGDSARKLLELLQSFGYSIKYAETMQPLLVTDNFESRHFDVVCII